MKGKRLYKKSVNSHKKICQNIQNKEKEKRLLLYRYMPYEAFEKTIEDWSLKLTIPYETNDPFEFMPLYQNLKNINNKQIIAAKDNPPGMLCFSTSMTSASMWGHYADRHKGVCLIFDFPCVPKKVPITSSTDTIQSYVIGKYENLETNPDPKLLIFPVIYSPQRPPCIQRHEYDASGGHDFGQLMRLLTTKDQSWKIEQEHRIFIPIKDKNNSIKNRMIFSSFHMKYLRGVILGPQCPYSINYISLLIQQKFKKLNKINNIEIYNSLYHPTEYKIIAIYWMQILQKMQPNLILSSQLYT